MHEDEIVKRPRFPDDGSIVNSREELSIQARERTRSIARCGLLGDRFTRHGTRPLLVASGMILVGAALAGAYHLWLPMGGILLLWLFVLAFFRNPRRQIPPGEETVVAPADGKIISVEKLEEEAQS